LKHVFISYVRENSQNVQRIYDELVSHGVKVWLDRNEIKPGYRWKDAIQEAIRKGDFFIACFSKEYSGRDKTFMNEELTLAIEELRQRPTDRAWFIPVLLSECDVPNIKISAVETLRDIQWVELYKDWQDGIQRILSVIQPEALQARLSGEKDRREENRTRDVLTPVEKAFLKEVAMTDGEFYVRSNDQMGEYVQTRSTIYAAKEFNGVLESKLKQIKYLDLVESLQLHGYVTKVGGSLYRITAKGLQAIGM